MTLKHLNPHSDLKNPGIKRAYFPLPEIRDNITDWCKVEICIPDDDDYRILLSSVLDMLSTWAFYERTDDQGGTKVAKVWRKIRETTDLLGSCGGCGCGDDGGCGQKMLDCGCCDDE